MNFTQVFSKMIVILVAMFVVMAMTLFVSHRKASRKFELLLLYRLGESLSKLLFRREILRKSGK